MIEFPDPAEPRDAAAVILLHGEPFRVLLARRNDSLAFMGGHHVFPGGRVDREDAGGAVHGAASPEDAAAIFAAAREVFEEAGILCARGPLPAIEDIRAARRALAAGERAFAAILQDFSLRIDAGDFTAAGLWITPPFSPIRYRTRYFLYRLNQDPYDEPLGDEAEITRLDWRAPAEARRAWQRGELKLSTPIAFVLRHLAELPLPSALPLLHHTPGSIGHRPNRFELRRGIHIIPLKTDTLPPANRTNTIVAGESELEIIDPGVTDPQEREYFIEHLEQLQALGGRVRGILLTHSHPDHAAGAEWLRDRFEAPIRAHPAAAAQLGFAVDAPLEDGQVIDIPGDPGWSLRCIHTPGHDPGHLCFLESSTQTLIGGDMAGNPGTIIISPDHGGDMTAYLHSLERVLALPFNLLIPAHGMPFFGEHAREKLRALIAHRLEREAKVRAALDEGARTLDELLPRVYADTPREAWPLARHSLRAHLERLGAAIIENK